MKTPFAMLTFAAAILAVTLAFAPVTARADQSDPRLGELFDLLKQAPDPYSAFQVEQLIWGIWLESDDPEAAGLMAEGIGAMNRADLPAALELFDRLVEAKPDFAEGWNKRATVHYLMGHFEESLADIDRTLELEPRHFGALSGLGLVQINRGQEVQALDAFERALVVYPQMQGPRENADYLRKKIDEGAI